jgi:hypothetical protein
MKSAGNPAVYYIIVPLAGMVKRTELAGKPGSE